VKGGAFTSLSGKTIGSSPWVKSPAAGSRMLVIKSGRMCGRGGQEPRGHLSTVLVTANGPPRSSVIFPSALKLPARLFANASAAKGHVTNNNIVG
jgi:hypothetical protein